MSEIESGHEAKSSLLAFAELVGIFERLGGSAPLFQARLQKLRGGCGLGCFLSTIRSGSARLRRNLASITPPISTVAWCRNGEVIA